MNDKAKFIIVSVLTDKVLRKIQRGTAKEIWTSLCRKYEEKDAHGINYTRKSFSICSKTPMSRWKIT